MNFKSIGLIDVEIDGFIGGVFFRMGDRTIPISKKLSHPTVETVVGWLLGHSGFD
jgi:hypothetical protein